MHIIITCFIRFHTHVPIDIQVADILTPPPNCGSNFPADLLIVTQHCHPQFWPGEGVVKGPFSTRVEDRLKTESKTPGPISLVIGYYFNAVS